MIVAENDRRCEIGQDTILSSIPIDLEGYYQEFQISNYTTTDIYLLFSNGEKKRFPVACNGYQDGHVAISCRTIIGRRVKNPSTGEDITKVPKVYRKIPEEVLLREPVYLRSHDVVICRAEHLATAFHPNSAEHRAKDMWRMHQAMAENCREMPYIIIANDPKKRFPYLYVEVNGRIAAVQVSQLGHFDEDDRVTVCYRDVNPVTGVVSYDTHRTSFSELLRDDEDVWEILGHLISTSRERLQVQMDLRHGNNLGPKSVSLKAHADDMQQLKKLHAQQVEMKDKEITTLSDRVRQLERQVKEMKDASYSELNSQIELAELSLNREKLEHNREQLDDERRKAQQEVNAHKWRVIEEGMKTIGTVMKTAAVALPAAVALHKAIIALKSS